MFVELNLKYRNIIFIDKLLWITLFILFYLFEKRYIDYLSSFVIFFWHKILFHATGQRFQILSNLSALYLLIILAFIQKLWNDMKNISISNKFKFLSKYNESLLRSLMGILMKLQVWYIALIPRDHLTGNFVHGISLVDASLRPNRILHINPTNSRNSVSKHNYFVLVQNCI